MNTKLPRSGQFLGDEQVRGEVAEFNGVVRKAFSQAGIWKQMSPEKRVATSLSGCRGWGPGEMEWIQVSEPGFWCLLAWHLYRTL